MAVADFSDYKEHKITEENVGFKLLQKAGWTEGVGLGAKEDGITAPINKLVATHFYHFTVVLHALYIVHVTCVVVYGKSTLRVA